jgi:hypothetical protein
MKYRLKIPEMVKKMDLEYFYYLKKADHNNTFSCGGFYYGVGKCTTNTGQVLTLPKDWLEPIEDGTVSAQQSFYDCWKDRKKWESEKGVSGLRPYVAGFEAAVANTSKRFKPLVIDAENVCKYMNISNRFLKSLKDSLEALKATEDK